MMRLRTPFLAAALFTGIVACAPYAGSAADTTPREREEARAFLSAPGARAVRGSRPEKPITGNRK